MRTLLRRQLAEAIDGACPEHLKEIRAMFDRRMIGAGMESDEREQIWRRAVADAHTRLSQEIEETS